MGVQACVNGALDAKARHATIPGNRAGEPPPVAETRSKLQRKL